MASELSYTTLQSGSVAVFAECRCVGHIICGADGYQYKPKGHRKHADTFSTVDAVKEIITKRNDT